MNWRYQFFYYFNTKEIEMVRSFPPKKNLRNRQLTSLSLSLSLSVCVSSFSLTTRQYDIKNKRTFLKRCPYDSIQPDMLYLGAKIVVYSRQLTIVDFADTYTRNRLQKKTER